MFRLPFQSFPSFPSNSLTLLSSSSSFSNSNSSSNSSSSLSLSFTSKREYLLDYNKLTNYNFLKLQFKEIFISSLLLQSLELLNIIIKEQEKQLQIEQNKQNKQLQRKQKKEKKEEREEREEERKINYEKEYQLFFYKFIYKYFRNTTNFIVKKLYEMIFIEYFNKQLCDKLTKDINKSIIRKLNKYSQYITSQKIFFTCFKASLLRGLSIFTVDCLFEMYNYFFNQSQQQDQQNKNKKPITPLSVLIWTSKRALFHGLSIIFFSGGYSFGLLIHTKLIPLWSATIFESIGAAILTPLLIN